MIFKRAMPIWAGLVIVASPVCALADSPVIDSRNYDGAAWSPYIVGAGIGVLAWLTFFVSDRPIGASTFYAQVAGLLGRIVAPRRTESLEYFKNNPPNVGWEFMFVLATIAGAAIAASTGGEFANQWLHPMWEARFGEGTIALRAAVAIAGGILMAFGARLAGGCTSGHGISGTLQLNVGSWIAAACFFIGGIAVAFPLYRWAHG